MYFYIGYSLFYSILISEKVIITYGIHPFNIVKQNPILWLSIRYAFIISYIFSSFIIGNFIFVFIKDCSKICADFIKTATSKLKKRKKRSFTLPNVNREISLFIGNNSETNLPVFIFQKSLYQNILITGTIGTGKTSSAMYPFTKQLMKINQSDEKEKIGMLILDVKGNYHLKVLEFARELHREDDVIIIKVSR